MFNQKLTIKSRRTTLKFRRTILETVKSVWTQGVGQFSTRREIVSFVKDYRRKGLSIGWTKYPINWKRKSPKIVRGRTIV